MAVSNMEALNALLTRRLNKAMRVASEKALADMYDETGGFYTGGEPEVYERTGALGDTPRTTAITTNGYSASFEAYLDQKHRYTSGKKPTMLDVLNLANDGKINGSVGYLKAVVGKGHFWDRAEKKMKKDFERTMKQFFK